MLVKCTRKFDGLVNFGSVPDVLPTVGNVYRVTRVDSDFGYFLDGLRPDTSFDKQKFAVATINDFVYEDYKEILTNSLTSVGADTSCSTTGR